MGAKSKKSREDVAERATAVLKTLRRAYPDAKIVLNHGSTWELLVAVILSAQCTDKMVNRVTEDLFRKYRTVSDYAAADTETFQAEIRPTGFFRNKTKSIIGAARMLLSDFGGEVPHTMQELLRLPGVARKTANIVLGNAFGVVEGVAVDTHVKRLSQRLGFSRESNPDKIERDLMVVFPPDSWFSLTYLLIEHGRRICTARRPACHECVLADLCPSAFTF